MRAENCSSISFQALQRQAGMAKRWTAKSPMSGYLVAIAATLTVLLVRLLLSPILGDSAYFFPFVIAVTLSAWYGGLNPGLVSTVFGSFLAVFFFVPPYYSLSISDSRIAVGLVLFFGSSVIISLVCDALHKALRRVELSEAEAVQHLAAIEGRDQALRDAREQLHVITDSMSALVTRCTPELKYAWVSKPYADWLQRSRDEIIGAPIEQILGPPAFSKLLPYFQRALKGETVTLEHEVDFRTIGRRWVNTVYTPTFEPDGKPSAGWVLLSISTNKSDRKRRFALRIVAKIRSSQYSPTSSETHSLRCEMHSRS